MTDNGSGIAGVICDLDGCLVDTETAYIHAWTGALETFAVEVPDAVIRGWSGHGWDDIVKQIDQITQNHELTLLIREARERIFYTMMDEDLIQLMPGTLELLRFSRESQLITGLASSTLSDKGKKILDHFGLADYFDFTVFGDEVAKRKPAGDIYWTAVKKSGLAGGQLLVFEDSIIGCQAAEKAELKTIWVPEEYVAQQTKNLPKTILQVVPSLNKGKEILQNYLENGLPE